MKITRRLVSTIPLLFGLATIVFVISRLAPGDLTTLLLSPTTSPQMIEELRRQFGLDQPLFEQYIRWLGNVFHGDLGVSFSHKRPVVEVIADFLPNTALLAFSAVAIQLVLGVTAGGIAARHRDSLLDKLITNAGLVLYTFPTFWVGVILLAILSYGLGLFPSAQMHSLDAGGLPPLERTLDLLAHLVLPACTIAIPGAAGLARYFRTSLADVQTQDYVMAARAMGIAERTIFLRYELPNAFAPVITLLGLELGALLTGALVTETIFAWPGMGRLTVMAVFSRDYPLIMGCTVVAGALVILGNLAADFFYRILDPRVRIS